MANIFQFPKKDSASDEDPDLFEIELQPGDDDYQEPEPEEKDLADQSFDGNLAETLDDNELMRIGMDLMRDVDADIRSRWKWEKVYKDSLKYLGVEQATRSTPWANACAVVHPGMLQGIVRFQSRALGKLFPSNGPCALAVKGIEINPQLQLIINRAQELYNHHITNVMIETQTETDRLLFGLAQIGFAAKKVYFDDDQMGRTVTHFVEAEDFILPYGTDNIEVCPRFTQRLRLSRGEVENLVIDGVYKEGVLPAPNFETLDEIAEEKTKLTGQDQAPEVSDHVKIYEVYVNLRISDDEYGSEKGKRSPYIVSIDEETEKIYRIERNWKEADKRRKKRVNFALYRYVPADGSYGLGLVHLTGQLIMAATRILREVIDSGELANLPGILKSSAARMKSESPVAPGELRDVNLSPDELKNAFFPLPFKEPSPALIQLLELIISEIKAFSSTADLDISASSQNAPVGTTLALLERQTEISNAVQKRMHASFSRELILISEFMKEYEPEVYNAIFGELEQALQGKGILVLSASGDPGSSTMAQRVMQLQAVMQNSAQAPQVYNLPVLHRTMITAMGLPDSLAIVPDNTNVPAMGIVEEISALLNSQPTKAFPDQDHKSHIAALMSFLNDPMYQQLFAKAPNAQQIVLAAYTLIAQHAAFEYREEIQQQLGGQLPPAGQPLSPEIESTLSQLVAQAAGRVAQAHAAAASQRAQQQQAADPAYQLEKEKLQLEAASSTAKHGLAQSKLELDAKKADTAASQAQDKLDLEFLQVLTSAKNDADILDQEAAAAAHKIGDSLLGHAQHQDKIDQQQQQTDQAGEQARVQAEQADKAHELAQQQADQAAAQPASGQ